MPEAIQARKVIAGAIVFVAEKRTRLAKALLLPFLLYCALDIPYFKTGGGLIEALFAILGLFIQTYLAVTTHRIMLLGDEAVPEWGVSSWGKRETYFLAHLVLVSLCILPSAVLAFIPYIGPILAIAGMAWIFARLSLVFPAIAIDEGVGIPLAWELSRRHQMLMISVVILFPLALSIPAIGLLLLIFFVPAVSVLVSMITGLVTVFGIAALSLAYREIRNQEYGNADNFT